jgi:hypothetical protein
VCLYMKFRGGWCKVHAVQGVADVEHIGYPVAHVDPSMYTLIFRPGVSIEEWAWVAGHQMWSTSRPCVILCEVVMCVN